MKRKLLFAMLCIAGALGLKAQKANLTQEKGWEKITVMPDVNQHFFALYDHTQDLGLVLKAGVHQGQGNQTLWYTANVDPQDNLRALFTLKTYNQGFVMTNVDYPDFFLQTEWNSGWNYRTSDNGGGNEDGQQWGEIRPAYTSEELGWTIQNGKYPDSGYLGAWENTIKDNAEVALNKTGQDIGYFDIYAIKCVTYVQHYIEKTKEILNDKDYVSVIGAERKALSDLTAPNEGSLSDCMTAISDIKKVYNTFINAKATYEDLTKEIAKAKALGLESADEYAVTGEDASALKNLQDLKVAEYNHITGTYQYGVELGEWTSTGVNTKAADFSNQHWSGETRSYKNQDDTNGQGWNANSWSINFNQDVTLPAGDYVFKVAGRHDATTTELVVKKGEETLGTADFPRGNVGRGINKSGKTSFDEADDQYANEGKGFGWEWCYVRFVLDEEATINIAVSSIATGLHQWVSFGDYTVQSTQDIKALVAYNIALRDAKAALENEDYTNVTGKEKDDLKEVIAAAETLDKTNKTAMEEATTNLDNAKAAFVDAKKAYDTFVKVANDEYKELPYASAEKYDAIAEAKKVNPTTAAGATEGANAILSANRKYVESNALAEAIAGAKVIEITDACMESGYDAENTSFGAWKVVGQTNGTIQLKDDESFTDGEGKNNYKYADIYKNDNNAGIQQTITLEPGKYMLTVTARAKATDGAAFRVFAGDAKTEINRIGNSGGVFDRGWNDFSVEFTVTEQKDVNIGVQAGNGKDLWWSATRFRLVKLADVATLAVTEAQYATFVAPFDVEIPEGVTASTVTGSNGTTLELSPLTGTIPAHTPVVLFSETSVTKTVEGIATEGTPQFGLLTGVYTETVAPVGSYVLQNQENGVAFYHVEKEQPKVGANHAYLMTSGASGVNAFRLGNDDATGIEAVEGNQKDKAVIYDLTGRRVEKAVNGLYIINGKKVVIK